MESANVIHLRIAFSAFDADADGTLTVDEFRSCIAKVAPHEVEPEAMDELVQRLDANGDGLIVIDEWLDFCLAAARDERIA